MAYRLGMALTLAAVLIAPMDVTAFHGYSITRDVGASPQYGGIRLFRDDSYVVTSANDTCDTTFSGFVVYQTQWVIMDPLASTWIELGTGHRTCPDGTTRHWWFGWMSNPNGFNSWLFVTQINPATHWFSLTIQDPWTWYWIIDITTAYTYQWGLWGTRIEEGLESYDASAVVPIICYCGIRTQVRFDPWVVYNPSPDSPLIWPGMAGSLIWPDQHYAAEN